MTREGGRVFHFFPKFDIQVLFRPENLPWSLWKKKQKKKKQARCSDAQKAGRPWGRAPLSAFMATWGWCLILPQGNDSVSRDRQKFQLNSHQQAYNGDGALTCVASHLFFFPPFTWIETAGFLSSFRCLSRPQSSMKCQRNGIKNRRELDRINNLDALLLRDNSATLHSPSIFTAAALPLSEAQLSPYSRFLLIFLLSHLSGAPGFLWAALKTIFCLVTKCQVSMMGGTGIRGVISEVAASVVFEPIAPMSKHTECAQPSEKRLRRTALPK